MADKYYMAADGGGTKLLALIFNDSHELISVGRGGAINQNFTDTADIELHVAECVNALFNDTHIGEIECMYTSMAGPTEALFRLTNDHAAIKSTLSMSEGYASLLAAIQKPNGLLALSGTGSDIFYQCGEHTVCGIGGWGALFGDEGSGYDIGARALRAIEFATDGRGAPTLMSEQLIKDFGLRRVQDIIGRTYSTRDYRGVISSVCLTCLRAAQAGDEAAIDIMRQAGREMALQTTTLIKKHDIPRGLDIAVSGSVWKYNNHMYEAFCEAVHDLYADYIISKPMFEPVMGGVVHHMLNGREELSADEHETLKSRFSRFIYEK